MPPAAVLAQAQSPTPAAAPAATPPTKPKAPDPALAPPPKKLSKSDRARAAAAELFNGTVPKLTIKIEKEELEQLRRDLRKYVRATVIEEGGPTYENVGVHLKGAAGSFQDLNGKPGWTLSFNKYDKGRRFHGLRKIHLNNLVQDGSYMNELIGGELARKAGVPAGRCTHAFVQFNERNLGLYVLKEGFSEDFLEQYFMDTDGLLYDCHTSKEITDNPEIDSGIGPTDRSDLKALAEACREPDHAKRLERMGKLLDLDRYISMVCMEAILCHWDGYSGNRNNWRIYHDPVSDRLVFLMHGMDQLFGDPNAGTGAPTNSLVTRALMELPEGQRRYRERMNQLVTEVFKPDEIATRITEVGQKLRDAIATRDPNMAKNFENQLHGTRDRVGQRFAKLERDVLGAPKPLNFSNGIATLEKLRWEPKSESGSPKHEVAAQAGLKALRIAVAGTNHCLVARARAAAPGQISLRGPRPHRRPQPDERRPWRRRRPAHLRRHPPERPQRRRPVAEDHLRVRRQQRPAGGHPRLRSARPRRRGPLRRAEAAGRAIGGSNQRSVISNR